MNILIVEDNDLKYRRLRDAINAEVSSSLTRAKNQRSALSNLRRGGFDLLLLDMTFEVLENRSQTATLQALAGLQVLQYMRRTKIHVPVVVVTQHSSFHQPGTPTISSIEELDDVLRENFSLFYRGYVYMTETNSWKQELSSYLRE